MYSTGEIFCESSFVPMQVAKLLHSENPLFSLERLRTESINMSLQLVLQQLSSEVVAKKSGESEHRRAEFWQRFQIYSADLKPTSAPWNNIFVGLTNFVEECKSDDLDAPSKLLSFFNANYVAALRPFVGPLTVLLGTTLRTFPDDLLFLPSVIRLFASVMFHHPNQRKVFTAAVENLLAPVGRYLAEGHSLHASALLDCLRSALFHETHLNEYCVDAAAVTVSYERQLFVALEQLASASSPRRDRLSGTNLPLFSSSLFRQLSLTDLYRLRWLLRQE